MLPLKSMKKLIILWIAMTAVACKGDFSFSGDSESPTGGKGGSMARFTITNDYLYIVNSNNLKSFNISNPADPIPTGEVPINAYAETIFPFKNHLLIGTRTGMYIFGLNTPSKPSQVSVYQHFASCDPVVAAGDYAYVTLRRGTPCTRGQNQLDILNIAQLATPQFVVSYPMLNPHGLGVTNKYLFLCEGASGFKIYDRTNPTDLKMIDFKYDIKSFDVIPLEESLVITGEDGIYQYAFDQKGNFELLSKISVTK